MNSAIRRGALLLSSLGLMLGASCSDEAPGERTAGHGDAILGGNAVPNPEDTGHVIVGPGNKPGLGSGTLLDNSSALSAAHNLDQSNCPGNPLLAGNTSFDCFFRPQSHVVALGNLPFATERIPNRISVHPGYVPVALNPSSSGIDVAVLRTTFPFTIQGSTSSWQQNISFFPPPAPNSLVQCFGYGQGTLNTPSTAGTLREGTFIVSAATASTFTFLPNASVIPYHGDSGGPCYAQGEFDIGGVMRDVWQPNPNLPPTEATAVAAAAFRTWETLVSESLLDFNIDVDFDGIPDSVFLLRNQTSVFFPGLFWQIKVLTSEPGSLCENVAECRIDIFQDDGAPLDSLAFVGGDFNNDTLPDVVGQINNFPFYFSSDAVGSFVDTGFTFLPSAYESFFVGDFNEDGTPDIEAHDTDGFVDVYFGQAGGGLQPGLPVMGFPALSAEDGKLATVSGKGNATVNFPSIRYYVNVPAGRTSFDVHVFDGDQGGADDVVGGVTCFSLHADGDYDGVSDEDIVTVSSDTLKEHAWSKIFSGPTHDLAKTPTGDFNYFLQVDLVEGSCAAPLENNLAAINSFLVRATGDLWVEQDQLSLMGWDTIGDAAPSSLGSLMARDNAYDGTFSLVTDVGVAAKSVTFRDADADDLDDASDSPGQYGLEDVQSTGVAVGANIDIRYEVYDENLALVIDAQNVSGNNDPTGPLQDVEERTVPTNGVAGWWSWVWSDVLAANNVHIWVPLSNVASPGWPLRLAAKPLRPLHWSTARTLAFWQAHPDAIAPLLPITLGSGDGQIVVSDLDAALAILGEAEPAVGGAGASKVALCHAPPGSPAQRKTIVVGKAALNAHLAHGDTLGPTQALAALAAELLAAKLNVAGAAPGEDLTATRIYATGTTVGEAVGGADGYVVGLGSVCDADAGATVADIEHLTLLLRATNRAEVTNVFPQSSLQAQALPLVQNQPDPPDPPPSGSEL